MIKIKKQFFSQSTGFDFFFWANGRKRQIGA
jgi:hypothetical protein